MDNITRQTITLNNIINHTWNNKYVICKRKT